MRKSEARAVFPHSSRIFVVVVGIAAVSACSSTTSHPAAQSSPSFSDHAATLKACKALDAWENGNATDKFWQDPASAVVENDAENTPFETDLQAWVNDAMDGAPYQQTSEDADKVGADCGVVGAAIFGTGNGS